MKKIMMITLVSAMLFGMSMSAFAAEAAPRGCGRGFASQNCGSAFVDANGDGVCDNRGTGYAQCTQFTDKNGDGICDFKGQPNRQAKGCRGGRWQ